MFEQATFLAAGLLLWLAVVGGSREPPKLGAKPVSEGWLAKPKLSAKSVSEGWRAAAGIGALLFTSIHMTLLGALFALAPKALYAHGTEGWSGLFPLADQQLGGAIMLLVVGASYLIGGLWLTASVLRDRLEVARR